MAAALVEGLNYLGLRGVVDELHDICDNYTAKIDAGRNEEVALAFEGAKT